MGVLRCTCSVTGSGTGVVNIPGAFGVDFNVNVDICPNCTLANSVVTASFLFNIIGADLSATFEATDIGFPFCTTDGRLLVNVEGELSINNEPAVPVTFTLTVTQTEVCIPLTIGPFTLPCLPVGNIVFGDC